MAELGAGAGRHGDSNDMADSLDHSIRPEPGRASVPFARPTVPSGSRVTVNPQRRDRRVGETGLVVGPDQRWFPNPHSVWVKFGSGLTILIAVTDLIIVPADRDAEQITPPN